MDRTELAWAAGFWDGEGSAWLTRSAGRTTWQPQARINQSSTSGIPQVLLRFRAVVGRGRVLGPEIEDGKEPLYRWIASSREDIDTTFRLMRPWLGAVKRRQFTRVLGAIDPEPQGGQLFDEELRAWAAGLFDGEGWTCLSKHRTHAGYRVIEAGVGQTSSQGSPEVLRRFHELVGVGKIYGPYGGDATHSPVYRWKTYVLAELERTMATVWPWLGDVKRRQADAAISAVKAQPPLPRGNPAWGNRKTHCVNGHEYATARVRRFRSRGRNAEPRRDSQQCLACLREYAKRKRKRLMTPPTY